MASRPILEPEGLPAALLTAGDLLDAGVLTTDEHLVVRGWNRWLAAATGWQATEVEGRSLLDLFPSLARTPAEAAFRRALQGETIVFSHRFHEYLLPLGAGPAFPEFARMQQSARIVPLAAGERVVGTMALVQDVTERVAREAELRQAMERAEAASIAKSEFIAAMSHELRTPLSAIIGYADILQAEIAGPLSSGQKQHMNRVKLGAWHLMGIIEEILTFSRADAGREEVRVERVEPAAVVRDAVALVEPQAAEKGLLLRTGIAPVPAMATDPGKLRQILVNLLGNAVKFTERGEVEAAVRVEGDAVAFDVRDTGPGISPQHHESIFEPFTQVDYSLTRVKGGTGLGLAVSRRLARLLGGDLSVQSTVGVGTVFTLRVPRGDPEAFPLG